MTRVRHSIIAALTMAGVVVGVGLMNGQGQGQGQTPAQAGGGSGGASAIKFTTLPGFTIERIVPASKTDSYVVMTFDSLGRLVVSKEYDTPRILLDNDGDGIFESEKVITDKVKNCEGLWFDGRTLYGNCAPATEPPGPGSATGVSGLYKLEDTDGDDVADTFETLATYVGGIQEHGPHAIRRGPDGEMFEIDGNNTFVPDAMIDPMSPLRGSKESQFLPALPDGRGFGPSVKEGLHAVVSRFDRQAKHYTLIAGGLRNAYDFAFNAAGELFTFDSDMEWDINMPWYRPVRSVHLVPGGNYGYRNGSGKFPPYYIDSLPAMRDLGRGSPVGVEFYQHTVYPREFRDAYFEADWSRGRLLWTALERDGATYKTVEEKTEFVHGEPLNITDTEVGPDGLIYFTTGGRGTEGGVYRVRYVGGGAAAGGSTPRQANGAVAPVPVPKDVRAVVQQPQPLSSWGWAALEQAKRDLGASWASDLEKLARDSGAKAEERAQAIYLLQQHGPAPSAALLSALVSDGDPLVRAAVVYVAGVQGPDAKDVAATALKDADPFVQRRAAEALVRMGLSADKPSLAPVADIYALLRSPDRFVRWSGRVALERTPRAEWQALAQNETALPGQLDALVALIETSTGDADLAPVFEKTLALLAKPDLSTDDKLRAIRTFQLATLSAKTVSPAVRKQVHDLGIAQFPAAEEPLNREWALVLAWTGQPDAVAKILAAMPKGEENQQLQLHYVYALRTIKTGWTAAQKAQMTDWYVKAAAWRGGASFPGFINLMFDASLQSFTPAEKKAAYAKLPQFAPLTEEEIAEAAKRTAAMRAAALGPQGAQRGGNAAATAAPRPRPNGAPASARAKGVAALSREEIMQEQIFTPLRQPASAEEGKKTYDQICASCHRFGAEGTDIGPDLTTISSRFQKRDILEAILWPSRTISDQYQLTLVETTDGKSLSGFIVREDGTQVVLRTPDGVGRSITIPKAQIKSQQKSPVSLMPEGLVDDLSQQEIANLIAFLQNPPRQQ